MHLPLSLQARTVRILLRSDEVLADLAAKERLYGRSCHHRQ